MSKTRADIIGDIEEAGLEGEIEAFYGWWEEHKRIKRAEEEERGGASDNLISYVEMEERIAELRNEMNWKFERLLTLVAFNKNEAVRHVQEWDAGRVSGIYEIPRA